MSVALHQVLERAQLTQPNRAARMELLRRVADLRAHPEFAAVSKPRGRVDIHARGVHAELLLAEVLHCDRIALIVDAERPLTKEELADLLMEELAPRGVGVILEASHSCMTIRGVRKPDALCITSAMRGAFRDNPATRSELMALICGGR